MTPDLLRRRLSSRTRLVAVSWVTFDDGYRHDLAALAEVAHAHGALFVSDVMQGLGAFPLDVQQARVHALAADGHKWMLGPEGCGILFISQELQDSIRPVEFGWTNVAKYSDYASRDMTLRPDAGRYECGTLNTIGCYGLRAIGAAVQQLGDLVADGVQSRGYEVLGSRSDATGAGIVSFRKSGVETTTIVQKLKAAGIAVAPRQSWVRVSPHFYISPDDIGKMLEALP